MMKKTKIWKYKFGIKKIMFSNNPGIRSSNNCLLLNIYNNNKVIYKNHSKSVPTYPALTSSTNLVGQSVTDKSSS